MFSTKTGHKVHNLIMKQINDVENCLIAFESFMNVATTQGATNEVLRTLSADIAAKEATADASLRQMIDSLQGGSYLPSTKEELIEIATSCDRVANKCEHTAMMLVVQKFYFPEGYSEGIKAIFLETIQQFELLEKSISLLFSDFKALLKDHSILDTIREHESRVDAIEQDLYEKLFSSEMDLAHQNQIATYIEWICDISDIVENIADKIQIMLIVRKA